MRVALAFLAAFLPALALANAAVFEEGVASSLDENENTSVSSAAFASACPTGATVEAYVEWRGSTDPSSVVDTASQTYTLRVSRYDSNSNITFALYTLANNQSDTTLSVTATWAAEVYNNGVWTKCLTGVATAAYQAGAANAQIDPGTAANAITSTAVTPTAQPALLSSVSVCSITCIDFAAGTGFTAGVTAGFGAEGASESQSLTSTSAIAATYTDATNGTTSDYLTIAAVYTAASAPPAVNPSQMFLGASCGLGAVTVAAALVGRRRRLAPARRKRW